jgi:parallel beta-helix repeat protein
LRIAPLKKPLFTREGEKMKKIREITIVLWLILSLFSVLVIVKVPEVEAELNAPSWNPNGYYETPNADWTIEFDDDIKYNDTKIVVNADLIIEDGGKLTLDNVTLQMNETASDNGDEIRVEHLVTAGELVVINGSTITTDPITAAQSPDPYEFRIDGAALIENSTVEKMKDLSGTDADGIQVYSDDVKIINSTIHFSEGNGVYVDNGEVSITNSTITNNNYSGLLIYQSSNNNIIGNNISSNNETGIYLDHSSYVNIIKNIIFENGINGRLHKLDGIHIESSSNNNIIGNNISSNNECGIDIYTSSNNNKIKNNTIWSNYYNGIHLVYSDGNNISGNNVSS